MRDDELSVLPNKVHPNMVFIATGSSILPTSSPGCKMFARTSAESNKSTLPGR